MANEMKTLGFANGEEFEIVDARAREEIETIKKDKLSKDEVPTKNSQLDNDSGFITKMVDDLANYYLKSETYTKDEVLSLVSSIPKFAIKVVTSLPTTGISTTTVYLVKSGSETDNLYTEYIYVNNKWEYLGKQTVDLSNYAKKSTTLAGYGITDGVTNARFTNHTSNTTMHVTQDEKAEWSGKSNFSGNYNDLSGKPTIPTKTSQLTNDSGFLTQHQDLSSYAKKATTLAGYGITDGATKEEVSRLSQEIVDQQAQLNNKQPAGNYALKSEIPSIPVQSVNGKTGAVVLCASDVGATTKDYVDSEVTTLKAQLTQLGIPYAGGTTIEEAYDWLKANGDTSKAYVVSDEATGKAYVYGYKNGVIVGGGCTNVLETATLHLNKRISSSGSLKDATGYLVVEYLPVVIDDVVRINKEHVLDSTGAYSRIKYYDKNKAKINLLDDANAYLEIAVNNGDNLTSFTAGYVASVAGGDIDTPLPNVAFMSLNLYISSSAITEDDVAELVMTLNEEIVEGGGTTIGYDWRMICEFVVGNNEERVNALGKAVTDVVYAQIETKEQLEEVKSDVEEIRTNKTSALFGISGVYAPSPQLPADGSEGSDFDANSDVIEPSHIYDYMDALVSKYPKYITKEVLGKDASGTYDWCRYTLCRRFYDAWLKNNYPPMYAWVNGSTVIYSRSVSPRIGDTMYTTKYIGTSKGTVSAVSNANQTRTVGGVVYTRDKTKDVEPTLVYVKTYYSPNYVGVYEGLNNYVYDSNKGAIATVAEYTSNTMKDSKGNTYTRYPLGDRDETFALPPSIVIGSNEHGTGGDPAEPSIISARMAKDLCECANASNPFLNMLKTDYKVVFCSIINPWGFSKENKAYYNANGINIDRNFDTPGWGSELNSTSGPQGDYGGSENETQYFMNTLVESKTKIAMANHALGAGIDSSTGEATSAGLCHWMLGRDNAKYTDALNAIGSTMITNYNLTFTDYSQAPPESYAKTRSYIDWVGAEGGAVEMQPRDGFVLAGEGELHTARIMEANYTLHLQFLHMLLACQEN